MKFLKSLRERIKTWRYRDSVRKLSRLSDRELADIGIKRIDVTYLDAIAH